MNFFEHQAQARRKTGRLIVLFVIAVILILGAVNLAAWGILHVLSPHLAYVQDAGPVLREDPEYPRRMHDIEPLWANPVIFAGVSLATLLIIGGGSAYKSAMLSRGGHAVASMLGGRPLDPQGAQGQDRVLQNVVEEMSIASGVPVPTVYVMENESGINAFAAGFTTEDAVIGVTRGCLMNLNRDELQGVVAHEFSHILNGDMRLNIRLIGILHGILVIGLMGYALLRTLRFVRVGGRRDKGGGQIIIVIMLAGAALLVIGYVGVFFGRLIQGAVSRQREFLADASAVQFTRNPRGIAGALMKIGSYSNGSKVENYHAVETAHMFFASGIKIGLTSLLATHPPLEERIRRIDPTFDGRSMLRSEPMPLREQPAVTLPTPAETPLQQATSGFAARLHQPRSAEAIQRARAALDPSSVADRVGAASAATMAYAAELLSALPPDVVEAAHDPFSARAVVFCLLISEEQPVREKQLGILGGTVEPACYREVLRLLAIVRTLGPELRLPLIDLCLPALRQMSGPQMAQFRQNVRSLIEADSRVTLFEYALLKVLAQHLKLPDDRARRAPVRYMSVSAVRDEAALLLTALAGASESDTRSAFEAGALRLDPENPLPMASNADLRAVNAALDRLDLASAPVKQRIIDAAAHTVASDAKVTVVEAELLRAIASAMDVPIPPLVPTPLPGQVPVAQTQAVE